MNLVTYFVNVAIAAAMTFVVSWIMSEPANAQMFAGALLGSFFWDYFRAGK